MSTDRDRRLDEAKAIPIAEIVHRLGVSDLKRAGMEVVGPCPKCGGRDRFGVNPARGVFNCRSCGGGDGIGLVQLVLGCDFKAALDWLVGAADVTISPAEQARRDQERARQKQEQDQRAAREREKAIAAARAIFFAGRPAFGTPVEKYLERRGLPGRVAEFSSLRFHPDLAYMVPGNGGAYVEAHRGPAMLAAVVDQSNRVTAVHRTWLDLSQPKGKAVISYGGRDNWPAKKVLGSKKGCAIRFRTVRDSATLVMAEGIETTLTALVAGEAEFSYWCGVDLGNMAGRRQLRGKGMKYAGIPDLDDREAFVPPAWVRRLVFVQDGDSDPRLTRAKLEAGLRRAKALLPALDRIQIVHAGAGRDLNDILMEGAGDDEAI